MGRGGAERDWMVRRTSERGWADRLSRGRSEVSTRVDNVLDERPGG